MNITSSIRRMVLMNRWMLLHSLYKLQKHKLHTDIRVHMRCCIKEWVFFLGSWGMNRSAGQTNRVNREAVLVWFVCSALRFIPMNPEKKTLIPYISMFPTRTLSKILREKLFIQNSHSNGHFTSFDVLITAHVIRPNRGPFCWLCSSGIELKFLAGFNEGNMIPL